MSKVVSRNTQSFLPYTHKLWQSKLPLYNEWEIDLIIYVYWLAITTIMNLWLTSRDYQIDTI